MGIDGEPGVRRGPPLAADGVGDQIVDALQGEMGAARGHRVEVLVKSLGATPLMELCILNARVSQRLILAGLVVHRTPVGPYCTSLTIARASITPMRLDAELERRPDHPGDRAMFRQGYGDGLHHR